MSFYIQPSTIIKLCEGVPLTPSYQNTLWFDTLASQNTYFASKVVWTFTQQSYQRRSRNRLRIKANAEAIEKVNYLIFDNNRWVDNTKLSKTYYAFVLDVVYINENTSEIIYQIDVMQTWFFDYDLHPCYIVREHVADDTIGLYTEPESFDLGPYQYESVGQILAGQTSGVLNNFYIILALTCDTNFDDYKGGIMGGVYSGLYYVAFPATTYGANQCTAFINDAIDAGKKEAIIYAFMAPLFVAQAADARPAESGTTQVTTVPTATFYREPNTSWRVQPDITGTPTYPRNNKLYCYPYNFFGVSNNNGEMATYAWERWAKNGSGYVAEEVVGTLSATTEMEYIPLNYAGVSGRNYNERIISANWPQCSWNSDPYKAWLATQGQMQIVNDVQSGLNMAFGLLETFAQQGGGMSPNTETTTVYGNSGATQTQGNNSQIDSQVAGGALDISAIKATANTIFDVAEIIQRYHIADLVPPTNHGASAGVIDIATNIKGFTGYNIRIRDEYLKKIDDYLSMYGYISDRVKIPNRHVRQQWTYTRTRNCSITRGSVPQNDAVQIEAIYNHGITFWVNPANVGEYRLSNLPLSALNE